MKNNSIFACFIALFLGSCQTSDPTTELYFVGDSHVARWDLQRSFPSFVTHNYGVAGSGIDYVESLHGCLTNRVGVVIIGTNDYGLYSHQQVEAYTERYIQAIEALGARHIYLYSIFPSNINSNDRIVTVNASIKNRVLGMSHIHYIDVYDALLDGDGLNVQFTLDGLHLNAFGYEVITHSLLRKL